MPTEEVLLANESYGVDEYGPLVRLHVKGACLPMSWDTALRIAAKLRVATRNALEYRRMPRVLGEVDPEDRRTQITIRDLDFLQEGDYQVRAHRQDVLLIVRGATLTMTPEVSRNISLWLVNSGQSVKGKYGNGLSLQYHVANLTDANATELEDEKRRDGTSAFK